jgi:hypothetical protein
MNMHQQMWTKHTQQWYQQMHTSIRKVVYTRTHREHLHVSATNVATCRDVIFACYIPVDGHMFSRNI